VRLLVIRFVVRLLVIRFGRDENVDAQLEPRRVVDRLVAALGCGEAAFALIEVDAGGHSLLLGERRGRTRLTNLSCAVSIAS